VLAGATAARADGVPGLRGHDHTGITVPDIKQAADFFINVLGCKEAMSFGPFADEKGNFMADLLNRQSAGGDPPDHPGALRLRLQHRAVSIQFARPENRYAEEQ
jgi:catechol 2,3-dioxygenase-like lactoylglutathione lyase family enzyme